LVDQVEISNVGGPKGVASEATLAALVTALNRRGAGNSRIAQLEELARNRNTQSIRNNTKETTLLSKAVGGAASAVTNVAKEFVAGGNRISDFSRAIFGANSLITGLTGFTDGLIDTFREMSTVGGSFSNSLSKFIKTSALTGMSLNEFSVLVTNNSRQLRMLGGSVSEGTARFGQISKELRRNFGSELTRVGFTMADMNEVLLEYTDFSISRMGRETRSNFQLAKAASQYSLELDNLARLTGVSKKQLAQDIREQQADQRIRAAMANMTTEQAERFNQALAVAGEAAPGLKEVLVDLSDGNPEIGVAQKLSASIPGFEEMAKNVENMSMEEMIKFFRTTGQQIDQFSKMPGFQRLIQIDGDFAEMASIGAGLRGYSDLTNEQIEKTLKEQAVTDRLTQTLANFELALNNLKSFILEEIINSPAFLALESFGSSLADSFQKLFGDGSEKSGVAGKAAEGFQSLTATLIGSEGIITGWINGLQTLLDDFNKHIDEGGNPMQFWKEKVGELATDIRRWFTDLFLGDIVARTPMDEAVRSGGLFEKIGDMFSNFWESPKVQSAINTFFIKMEQMFSKLLEMFGNLIREQFGGVAGTELSKNKLEGYYTRLKAGKELSSEETQDFKNTLRAMERSRILEEKGSGFLGWREAANFLGEASGFTSDLFFNADSWFADREDLISAYESIIPQRRIGTLQATGKMSEPTDMVAKIHSGERVLNPTETSEYNSTKNSQTELLRKVDQLNTTMMTVARILESGLDVQTKTMRNLKTVNGDFMKGIGR
jgi:hypothetical protein